MPWQLQQQVRKNSLNFAEHFGHLRLCIEPHWQAFGKSKATATADLIWLAKWLTSSQDKPYDLPPAKAACMVRSTDAILAAVDTAGGAHALASADPDAAICLYHSMIRFPGGETNCRVADAFAAVGPLALRAAAEKVREGVAVSPQRAVAAALLAGDWMHSIVPDEVPSEELSSLRQVRW